MTTPKQIDDGGSVTADIISQRYVAELGMIEEKVQSVGGLSVRDYFAAAALQGLICHYGIDVMSDENNSMVAYELADAMLAKRKGGA